MYVYGNGFAFLHLIKCGGNSIRRTIPEKPILRFSLPRYKHQSLSFIKKGIGDKFNDITIYANVRNPFDRLVSLCFYTNKWWRRSGLNDVEFFNRWLWEKFSGNYTCLDNPFDCMLLIDGKIPENVNVVRLEDANDIYPSIFKKHFGREFSLRKENKSEHRDYRVYYDSLSEQYVREREHWVLNNYYKEI
jgi:hypothetical protein